MSQDQSSDSERALVRAAAVSPIARAELRKRLEPYVLEEMREFIEHWGIPEHRLQELIAVGMQQFDYVFNIYLKNLGDQDEEEGHFYQYYIWWARQAVVAHLRITGDMQ